jgi:hypothetical protein
MRRRADEVGGERMKRRLLNAMAGVSLVSCVAFAALWMRSYRSYDDVKWFGTNYGMVACSGDGIVALMFGPIFHGPNAMQIAPGWRYNTYAHAQGDLRGQISIAAYHRLGRLGIAYDPDHLQTYVSGSRRMTWNSSHRVYLPHWLILVALLLPPAARIWTFRKQQSAPEMCSHCGYDLRATPDRCPECGAVPMKLEASA